MPPSPASSRPSVTRRASLTLLRPLPEVDDPQALPPDTADLRHLAVLCTQISQRCTAHEQRIARLSHEIDARIQRWHDATDALREVDEKATHLTEQLQASLAAVRTETAGALADGKLVLQGVDERVSVSRKTVVEATVALRKAVLDMDDLENKMVIEEETLESISTVTQLMLWSMVYLSVAFGFLLWWWNRASKREAVRVPDL